MKSFLVGLSIVCMAAIVIFLGYKFYFYTPKTPTVAQKSPTSKETSTGKKAESTPELYKSDRLAQVRFVPYYDRNNDVQVTNGEVTCSALAGSLHDDQKKGALVVTCYSDSSFLGRDQYVTEQDHGKLTVYEDGTQIRIVAEDGKEWHFSFEGSPSSISYSVY